MNPLEKFRYLGPAQTARKYALKAERALKAAYCRPPVVPGQDPTIDLQLTLLGCEFDLRRPNRWHYSPDTGKTWPLRYGMAVPLDVGDVKLVWELNRHQFLPALASKDPGLVRRILRDWVSQNPFEYGIHWNSALEVGIRLIAWLETFEKAPQLREEFSRNLAQHARFVRHHISADWVPRGNHLVGEAAALAVFEGYPNRWLEHAAIEQFYASGVHREQSVAYHHFVTHLFAVAGMPLPKAVAYLAAIRQPDGSLPYVGDNDNGLASTKPLEIPSAPTGSCAFPDAGHFVIRNGGDYCYVRCGEFGMPPNFSHGHADLLSPILWLRGAPILVDAGTFTYNGDPALRRLFRSAQAHNVVTVDDRDYAGQNGTFAWRNPPRGICETWSDREFVGSAGGHQRRISYTGGAFTITDRVDGTGAHQLRWRFHLHPDLKIIHCADDAFEFDGGFGMRVQAPAGARLGVGDGWYSPSYNCRVPIPVCEIVLDATLPAVATFTVQ